MKTKLLLIIFVLFSSSVSSIINRNLLSNPTTPIKKQTKGKKVKDHSISPMKKTDRKLQLTTTSSPKPRRMDSDEDETPSREFPCSISVRLYPMLYYLRTNSLDIKMLFRSSCLEYPIMQYFLVQSGKYDLKIYSHPSYLLLNVFGREFNIKFLDPYQRGKKNNLIIGYKYARVYPSVLTDKINLFDDNAIELSPVNLNREYTTKDIRGLKITQNPINCKVQSGQTVVYCEMGY